MADASSEKLHPFLVLMYEDDDAWATLSPSRQAELMTLYGGWVAALRAQHLFVSGAPAGREQVLLESVNGSIEARSHAPTSNVLTGYFVIRARDFAHAVDVARGCPALQHGERVVVRAAVHDGSVGGP